MSLTDALLVDPRLTIRENSFGYRDNAPQVGVVRGLVILGLVECEDVLVESNVIGLATPNAIAHLSSRNITAFNNRSSGGAIAPGYSAIGGWEAFHEDESVEALVEDTLIGALI